MDVCEENGVPNLFEHFLSLADNYPSASVQFNKKRSVAIHKGKPPVISLHPNKSRSVKGLWIGYSKTNLGRFISVNALPESFEKHEEMQGNNLWLFGFFHTTSDLDRLFEDVFGIFAN
jgi:hypothetical protein